MSANTVADGKTRCPWVDLGKPDYVAYHDTEWGVPVRDDATQFEFLLLETAQAGLSWYTVLKKRAGYRRIFHGFDVARVAAMTAQEVDAAAADPAIIRHRGKIEAAINNARCFIAIQNEFGSFCDYIWPFVDGQTIINKPRTLADYAATSPQSDALSKDMRKRGFKFVGSTTLYAHLQATGLINDHSADCFRQAQV